MREIVMTALQAGMRLDHFLERSLREAHTGFIYKMLRKKNITLNGHKANWRRAMWSASISPGKPWRSSAQELSRVSRWFP